jgi:hypothetical protein
VDTTYRDLILGHSLQGMAVYAAWLDGQLGNSDRAVGQGAVSDA